MCMGCMCNTEYAVSSGALGVASIRASLRMLLPTTPHFLRKVSDEEAAAFVASLQPGGEPVPRRPRVRAERWRPTEPARPAIALTPAR